MMVGSIFHSGRIIVLLALLAGAASAQSFEVSPANHKALGITTAPVIEDGAIEGVRGFGTVIVPPGNGHPVTSPIDAVLLKSLVVPGMQVKAGDPVAVLYNPEIETARANLETERLTVEHLDHLAERARELRALGLRSAQEVDEAEHDAKSARLAFSASQNRLRAAHSSKGDGRFTVVAPATGVVYDILAEPGEPVDMSQAFLSIFDGERYWLDVSVHTRAASNIRIGSKVELPDNEQGAVIAISPKVDAQRQAVRVMVELPPSQTWRLGQLVDLGFKMPHAKNALMVPARALVRIAGRDTVFVETENGFRVTEVTVVSRSRNEIILNGGLTREDRVAVSGTAALKSLAEGA
jgi:cobalt-zinc-cadmium efflux system membrane fusion protein